MSAQRASIPILATAWLLCFAAACRLAAQDVPVAPADPGTTSDWIGLLLDDRPVPQTPAEAQAMEARILAALRLIGWKPDLGEAEKLAQPLIPPLERQLGEVRGLRDVLRDLAALPAELEALRRSIELAGRNLDDAKRRAGAEPPPPGSDPVPPETLAAARAELQRLRDDLQPATARLAGARARVAARETVIKEAEARQQAALRDLAAGEAELRKALEQGAERAVIELLREQTYATRLQVARLSGVVELRQKENLEKLGREVEDADLQVKLLAQQEPLQQRVVAQLETQAANFASEQEIRAQRTVVYWERQLETAQAAERPFIELRLLDLRTRARVAGLRRDVADWDQRFGTTGDLGIAIARSQQLAKVLENVRRQGEEPPPDLVTPEGLRERRRRALLRADLARAALDGRDGLRAWRLRVDDLHREALKLAENLPARIQAAREGSRAADAQAARPGFLSAARWESLEQDLVEALDQQTALTRQLLGEAPFRPPQAPEGEAGRVVPAPPVSVDAGLIERRIGELKALQDRTQVNLADLDAMLLRSRQSFSISWESLVQAVGDATRLPDAALSVAGRFAEVAGEFVSGGADTLPIVLFSLCVAAAVSLFLLILLKCPAQVRRADAQPAVKEGEAAESDGDAARRHGRLLRRITLAALRAADTWLLLAAIGVSVALWMPFDAAFRGGLLVLALAPLCWSIPRSLTRILALKGDARERILQLDDAAARLLRRGSRLVTNVALIGILPGVLLDRSGYGLENPGFLQLWWVVFEIVFIAVVLATLMRPTFVGSVMRLPGLTLSTRALVLFAWPILLAGLLATFVLAVSGYTELAAFLRNRLALTVAWLLGAYAAYHVLLGWIRLPADPSVRARRDDYEDEQAYIAAGSRQLTAGFLVLMLRVLVFVPALVIVWRVWLVGLRRAASFSPSEGFDASSVLWAVVALGITFIVIRYIRDTLKFILLPHTGWDEGLRYTVVALGSYAVAGIGIFITLSMLKIDTEQITWVMSALAVGIGFGLQSVVRGFVAGLILLIERPVRVGDWVEVGTRSGTVEKITLRSTEITTWDGEGVVIPNDELIGNTIVNLSLGPPRLRTRLAFGVAYGTDIQLMRKVALEVANKHGRVLSRPPAEVVFLDFGASSLEFELRYWTTQNLRLRVQSDMRSALDAAFRRFGIEIPFAQRDVHLRSIDPDLLDRLRGAGRAGGPGAEEPASGNTPTEAADAAGKRALAVPSGPGAAGDGGAGGGSGEEGTGGGSGA